MKRSCATLLLCTLLPAADAAVFSVTRTDDPLPDGCAKDDCSLREAVLAANALSGRDTVQLLGLTYDLTRVDLTPDSHVTDRGPLWVTETLTIDGASIGSTRIRWNWPFTFYNQVFWTDVQAPGAVVLALRELTVSGGRGSQGGCIHMTGTPATPHKLILDTSRIEGCTANTSGGAAYLYNADLSLRRAQLVDNSAVGSGGALELMGPIDVDSQSSKLRGNHAGQHGGAVRIYGNGLFGLHSDVVWVDDGRSVVSDNHADGDGGAYSINDTATLDLSTQASAPVAQLLRIESNTAAGAGGGFRFAAGLTEFGTSNRLDRVRITDNTAASGGGVHTAISLHINASEVARNVASSGPGGGVALVGNTEWPGGRGLTRVGIHDNSAMSSGGGGVFSECATFQAENASIHANQAASGRGQGIETIGPAQLRHVSMVANNSLPVIGSPGLYKRYSTGCGDTQLQYANSLIADYCATMVTAQLVSNGGNQLGVDSSACPLLAGADEQQAVADAFLIDMHPWGGDFEVVGWVDDSTPRPQRDFGLATWCTATDARGFPRADGFCDSGAFEQQ